MLTLISRSFPPLQTREQSSLPRIEEASALRRLLLFSKAANGFGEKDLRSDPRVAYFSDVHAAGKMI